MKIAAFDPGLHHIVWTVTEWQGEEFVYLHEVRTMETPKPRRKGLDAALDTMAMIDGFNFPELLPPHDVILVEAQHTKAKATRSDDIRDLAVVTGGLVGCLPYGVQWAPTGPRGWSIFGKTERHNRMRDAYLVDHDLTQPAFQSKLKPIPGDRKTMTKRIYGDALDTVGMALWHVKGRPAAGI